MIAIGGCGVSPLRRGHHDEDLVSKAPPTLATALDEVYTLNRGLLVGVRADGTPFTVAPAADPAITEARRFYDTLQTPFPEEVPVGYPDPFTGEATPMRKTAPLTFEDWKQVFAFPERLPDEGTQAYRDRVGIAIYYNRNELGLGRELGCSRFVDGEDANGTPMLGVACFVTNYGPGFRLEQAALAAAAHGDGNRNTVCITYRPSMDAGYQVQFYVYGTEGNRQEWARLDTLGQRPHPHVCMNCHGGSYDDQRHLAKDARFLPIDANVVVFGEEDADPAWAAITRAAQEERLRVMNAMSLETPLTPAQRHMLGDLYADGIRNPGAVAAGDPIPDAWRGSDTDRDFYRGVVKPYCGTCHMARDGGSTTGAGAYGMFGSPQTFDRFPVESYVCSSFSMPNAQPTLLRFWEAEGNDGVKVGDTVFATAADALLARRGLDRATCQRFTEVSGCNRGDDPDALCGGAVDGGAICDLTTGRCVPVTTSDR